MKITPEIARFRAKRWPFASVDSADVARNWKSRDLTALQMADRWDRVQCPGMYKPVPHQQLELS